MQDLMDLLQQIHATLTQIHSEQIRQTFLLECGALTLAILWGATTWALVCLSKNEREFL